MFVVYILTSCPPSHSFVVMSRQRLLFVNVLLLVTRSCDVGHICLSATCSSAPPTSGVRFEKKKFCQQKCASQKAEKQKLIQGFCLLMYVAGHVSSFFPLCFLHDSAISLPQVGSSSP